VHETLLCEASGFFASASKKEWKEGQKDRIPLPDDNTSVVDLYVQWLYTGRIVIRERSVEEKRQEKEEKGEGEGEDQEGCKNGHEVDGLTGAFVFGEKVQDGDFKDAVIDALIHTVAAPDEKGVHWYPTAQSVDRAYTGTPEGSPIRRLLVDMYTFHGKKDWLDGQRNVDFLADLAGCLLRERSEYSQALDSTTPDVSGCQYHHHDGERGECYSAKMS
jgi:hypothetical protein